MCWLILCMSPLLNYWRKSSSQILSPSDWGGESRLWHRVVAPARQLCSESYTVHAEIKLPHGAEITIFGSGSFLLSINQKKFSRKKGSERNFY
jgi:hypothetical protein